MKYTEYKYLFPPRPIQTTSPDQLQKFDNGIYIAQPKYNGTCCVAFISKSGEMKIMNRHKGAITSDYSDIDFKGLHSGDGWMVLCGEFLNKNKKGEDGNPFNLKFIIWDILVYDGEYLIGKTLIERLNLLEKLFPCSQMLLIKDKLKGFAHLCVTKYDGIFKAPTYTQDFVKLYEEIVDTDLYEGLVLKRKDAKLSFGFNEKNNNEWQIKCRKPTKNYDF
jgi:ATP-dependent DNA ligase